MNKDIFKDNKDKILLEKLFSGNEKNILETINKIREKGSVIFLPALIDLYKNSIFQDVKLEIFDLLINLKDKNAKPYIIEAIQNFEFISIKKDLLSICWQSVLDFYDYIEIFVEIFVKDDFEIAFEAFTIIELIDIQIDNEIIEKQIDILKSNIETASIEKQILYPELIIILQNLVSD